MENCVMSYLTNRNPYLEVAKGNVSGEQLQPKFGRNPSVGTSWQDIWTVGGEYIWPTSAAVASIVSTSSLDTALGTGARSITVEGLDSSFNIVSETVNTMGVTAVNTTQTYIRISRIWVETAGTYSSLTAGGNAGTITCTVGGNTQAEILVNNSVPLGQGQVGRYTIPANMNGYFLGGHVSVDGNKSANIAFFQRQDADVTSAPYSAKRLSGSKDIILPAPIKFPEKTDLWWAARTSSGTSGVEISFDILLEET